MLPRPRTRNTRRPCSSQRPAMSAAVASKIRKPGSPSMATRTESPGFADSPSGCEQGLELRVGNPRASSQARPRHPGAMGAGMRSAFGRAAMTVAIFTALAV